MSNSNFNENSNFSGAGVLIFEKNSKGTYLILVHDIEKNSYTEPGGGFDKNKHKSIAHAAKAELFEETSALFKPKSVHSLANRTNFFDKKYRKKTYRTYMIATKNLNNLYKNYHNNVSAIFSNHNMFNKDSSFRETNNITRISLDTIYDTLLKNNNVKNVYVQDIYKKRILLNKRTVQILRHLFFNVSNVSNIKVKYIKPKVIKKNNLIHYDF